MCSDNPELPKGTSDDANVEKPSSDETSSDQAPPPAMFTYGLVGWKGDPDVVHRIALDPEFGVHEAP